LVNGQKVTGQKVTKLLGQKVTGQKVTIYIFYPGGQKVTGQNVTTYILVIDIIFCEISSLMTENIKFTPPHQSLYAMPNHLPIICQNLII
jgi:hypothetical protein